MENEVFDYMNKCEEKEGKSFTMAIRPARRSEQLFSLIVQLGDCVTPSPPFLLSPQLLKVEFVKHHWDSQLKSEHFRFREAGG